MSNGDMADPTTSGVVSSGTTPSSNRSLKDDGHNVETTVMSDAIVECLRGAESDSISGKELSNLVVDLPSTSDTQSTNLTLNSTYWRPGYPFASKSKSSSSAGKRKAALPKKRPAALEGPVNISADTGEVEEDSTSAAAEIVLGVDESGPVTRTGKRR
uniref:Uncharacterized protein n=1 Tax=Parascaris univalens TaxID=6257 RepID=A0A915C551_PARUN